MSKKLIVLVRQSKNRILKIFKQILPSIKQSSKIELNLSNISSIHMHSLRLVIIEDDDLTRIALKIGLGAKSEVNLVAEATTAWEGFNLIEQQKPDLAIIDLGLPDTNGIELIARLKAMRNTNLQYTKILVLTLQDREDAVMAAFQAGADSYCIKNTELERLWDAIQTTARGDSWIDPAIARIVLSHVRSTKARQTSEDRVIEVASATPVVREKYGLTERQLEVLQLIVNGESNAEIAQKLNIAIGTVKTHVCDILNKLAVNDRTQAAVTALREELAH
jgi:DNA-binding NarL/FixJ family response regulator